MTTIRLHTEDSLALQRIMEVFAMLNASHEADLPSDPSASSEDSERAKRSAVKFRRFSGSDFSAPIQKRGFLLSSDHILLINMVARTITLTTSLV